MTQEAQTAVPEIIGLHLNGDVAPWGEIEAGGRFERLANLPIAHSTIASAKGGNLQCQIKG